MELLRGQAGMRSVGLTTPGRWHGEGIVRERFGCRIIDGKEDTSRNMKSMMNPVDGSLWKRILSDIKLRMEGIGNTNLIVVNKLGVPMAGDGEKADCFLLPGFGDGLIFFLL